jgi:hypothetical protein
VFTARYGLSLLNITEVTSLYWEYSSTGRRAETDLRHLPAPLARLSDFTGQHATAAIATSTSAEGHAVPTKWGNS